MLAVYQPQMVLESTPEHRRHHRCDPVVPAQDAAGSLEWPGSSEDLAAADHHRELTTGLAQAGDGDAAGPEWELVGQRSVTIRVGDRHGTDLWVGEGDRGDPAVPDHRRVIALVDVDQVRDERVGRYRLQLAAYGAALGTALGEVIVGGILVRCVGSGAAEQIEIGDWADALDDIATAVAGAASERSVAAEGDHR